MRRFDSSSGLRDNEGMIERLILCFLLLTGTLVYGEDAKSLVKAARGQIGVTTIYDGAYVALSYPGGDVSAERGVCTDVVVRACRKSYDFDLQKEVHEDMKRHFSVYPKRWGLSRPDRNIDHRRVPNLQTYFTRHHTALPKPTRETVFLPGDLVTSLLPGNLPHIMIVSDRKQRDGVPLVIHNMGRGTREENALFAFPLTGHYRLKLP